MKCYVGGSRSPLSEYDFISACFANNAKEAKNIMWKRSDLCAECDNEWIEARVLRRKEHDGLIDTNQTEPYIIRDCKTLRLMGWSMEGDELCNSCGLAEYGGQYPVCEKCGQCEECEHLEHDDE